jgi:hypothetical protein
MPSRCYFLLLALLALVSCAKSENGWKPTIDTANDPHIDRLQTDLAGCKMLAEKAGEEAWTIKTRTAMTADDGTLMNGSEFRRSYVNCMKERKHPVVD